MNTSAKGRKAECENGRPESAGAACPKCGETRLIEPLNGCRWFCSVCASAWTMHTGVGRDGARAPLIERL
jgi:uncharacterized protein (DUF983 family)